MVSEKNFNLNLNFFIFYRFRVIVYMCFFRSNSVVLFCEFVLGRVFCWMFVFMRCFYFYSFVERVLLILFFFLESLVKFFILRYIVFISNSEVESI